MIAINKVLAKSATVALLPALALGVFAAPAMTYGFFQNTGVTTMIDVDNDNTGAVVNAFNVRSDTGGNTANGGDGNDGGDSGASGDTAGNGGDGGNGGAGGDATARNGDDTYAGSGYGAQGGNGGTGGSTGDTGEAGNGGNGGLGGQIATGNAYSYVGISNDLNSNTTEITINDDCECDRYNETFETADSYYERNQEDWSTESTEGDGNDFELRRSWNNWHDDDESTYNEQSSSDSVVRDTHWTEYTKTYVPVTTVIDADNNNEGFIMNMGEVESETGDNTANGGEAGAGGESGDSGSDAGNGGDGGNGGAGGDALARGSVDDNVFLPFRTNDRSFNNSFWNWDDDSKVDAVALDGGAGGDGSNGGSTGTTGDAGHAGDGAEGGIIVTGHADSVVDPVINVLNRNVTRITR